MAKNLRTSSHPVNPRQQVTSTELRSKAGKKGSGSGVSPAKLDALVSEAIIDSNDDEEQLMGLFSMIEEKLALPFETSILGIQVVVESVEQRDDRIVAICERDGKRQAISLLDLQVPSPPPSGAEWIEAYRHWSRF